MNKRTFLRLSSLAGGGLLLSGNLPVSALDKHLLASSSKAFGDGETPKNTPLELGFFLSIEANNSITFHLTKHEMGQGVATSLAAIVADELGADWQRVEVKYDADTAKPHTLGSTGGSTSVKNMWLPLRTSAAFVRKALLQEAAAMWSVPANECTAAHSLVTHTPSSRTATFGELAQRLMAHPERITTPKTLDELMEQNIPLKTAQELTLVGTQLGNKFARGIVTGKHTYSSDASVQGMLYAVVARCPVFRGELKRFDATKALAVPGVKKVVAIEGYISPDGNKPSQASGWTIKDGVAVLADSTWAALKGREVLEVEWDDGINTGVSTESFHAFVAEKAARPAEATKTVGSAAAHSTERAIEATYVYPYQTHACMEPMNAIAHHKGASCEVWVGTQFPNGIIRRAAQMFAVPESAIAVHPYPSGGGFGRRYYPDVALEALKVSQAAGNVPVKVFWSRADDLQHDSFHAYYWGHYKAGLADKTIKKAVEKADTKNATDKPIISWYHKELRTFWGDAKEGELPWMAYDIPTIQAEITGSLHSDSVLQSGAWRSVVANNWAFGQECFLDEIAHVLGEDPYHLRLRLLEGSREIKGVAHSDPQKAVSSDRMQRVLQLAAQKAGWEQPFAPAQQGFGRGIAVFPYMHGESYCAQVVEVSVQGGNVRVQRVVAAVDCGKIIDPDGVKKQIEGGIVWGLTAALYGGVELLNGAVQNSNFHNNPLLRLPECPTIEVHLVENSAEPPCGIGELSPPVVVPALCNALFAVTGKRIRTLPVRL